jgi:BASS family bile acid:Na+ symporter
LIGIPLLAVALVQVFDLPPAIAVGFFIVSAMPGGAVSNIYTFLGRGNTALSVALTAVMTLLALITVPLILRLFASEHIPPEIPMPTGVIIREIGLYLLLPLSAGMGVGRLTNHAHAISKWAIRFSLVGLAFIVIGSIGSGRLDSGEFGVWIPLLIAGFCVANQVIIMLVSLKLLKFSRRDMTALGIESSMKNINLSLLIAASLFPLEGSASEFGGTVLFVLLLYGGVSLVASASPAFRNYRWLKKQNEGS